MKLIDGKKVREELLKEYKRVIEQDNLKIKLAIIQVGNNSSSNVYINNKIKYCNRVGIDTELFKLDNNVTENKLIELIDKLNKDDKYTGIILQSPLPEHIDFTKCARRINDNKDVDGFSKNNLFGVRDNDERILPCTVKGILKLFEYYNIDLKGKNVVIIGRSNIVGRPLADALVNRDATVTLCHSKTKDISIYTNLADIIISAVGEVNLIHKYMVKDGFVGIDVGINFVDDKMVGDFRKDVYPQASYITPVPGGVGPMTVAMIIENLIQLSKQENIWKV